MRHEIRTGRVAESAAPGVLIKGDNPAAAIRAIKCGLPFRLFVQVRAELDVTEARLAGVIGIKPRTLARRKTDGRFTPEESDRLHRVASLWKRAAAFFKSKDEAAAWMKAPQYYFGDVPPLDFADTEVGTREVEHLLGRIEHGVF